MRLALDPVFFGFFFTAGFAATTFRTQRGERRKRSWSVHVRRPVGLVVVAFLCNCTAPRYRRCCKSPVGQNCETLYEGEAPKTLSSHFKSVRRAAVKKSRRVSQMDIDMRGRSYVVASVRIQGLDTNPPLSTIRTATKVQMSTSNTRTNHPKLATSSLQAFRSRHPKYPPMRRASGVSTSQQFMVTSPGLCGVHQCTASQFGGQRPRQGGMVPPRHCVARGRECARAVVDVDAGEREAIQ